MKWEKSLDDEGSMRQKNILIVQLKKMNVREPYVKNQFENS